jgi:uncharacterized protein (TIGR00251 family)
MHISVVAHANAKNPRVEEDSTKTLHVYVHAPPRDGKANEAVVKLLAKHFCTKKNTVILVRGEKSKHKVFEIT